MFMPCILRFQAEYNPDIGVVQLVPFMLDLDGNEIMRGDTINLPPHQPLDLGPFEARIRMPEAEIILAMGLAMRTVQGVQPKPDAGGYYGFNGDSLQAMG